MYDDNMHSDELGDDRHSADIVIIEDQYPDRNCKHCQSCCVCFPTWLRVQNAIYNFVHDPLMELFITLCIIVNTIFLAIEHHGMSSSLKQTLDIGNKVFTAIFFLETLLKLISMAKDYFKKSWNVFDLFIVIGSLMDLSLENVGGLSVLRALRLLRVFKLAQSWTTMRVLLSIIVSTLGALGNLTLVLVIIMYIFAVLGMQLFGRYYVPERFDKNEIPRWNFKDFVHSFMMIFRVLCGEWVEPLWDCMHAAGQSCMAIFLPALVVGNFIVLNLFLALLLSSFNSEELSKNNKKDEEASRLVLGLKRLKNLICCCRNAVTPLPSARRRLSRENSIEIDSNNLKTEKMMAAFASTVFVDTEELKSRKNATTNTPSDMANNTNIPLRHEIRRPSWTQVVDYVDNLRHGSQDSLQVSDQIFQVNNPMSSNYVLEPNTMDAATQTPDSLSLSSPSPNYTPPPIVRKRTITPNRRIRAGADKPRTDTPPSDPKEIDTDAIYAKASGGFLEEPEETKPEIEKEPEDCLPSCCYKRFICCRAYAANYSPRLWYRFRKLTMKFVDHWLFEWFIVILIFASSITLCFEDKYLQDNQQLVNVLYYLNWFFCAVYTIEMILKWIAHGFVVYFTNGWSILDFIIVAASIFSIVIEDNKNLIALRSMRTLRALRPLRAISRWQGMKIVVNALMSAIPSIFNVLLVCIVFWLIFSIMGVQFFAGRFYRCEYEDGSRVPITVVNNRSECEQKNLSWKNADINFDNVGQGYLALFQVATFEGWMEVMEDAVDARGVDLQPHTEANLTAYFYFIIFIVCGSFFTLNLFIGVIIDNFNMLKKKYEGGVLNLFLTESQKNYYAAMKKLGRKKPQKLIPRPSNCFHAAFYDVAMSRRFEMLIFFLILLNMITMGVEHYKQTEEFEYVLEILNIVFTSLFVTEALIKIIGLRHWYFRVPWNVFDFILVTSSLLGIILKDILTNFIVSPSLLRVVRVFRIGRILRLIKAAKGIRKLLFALVVSLPALFNIGALIFLIMFIYAIIGMSLFSRIKHTDAIDDLVNFETFGRSMLLLFRLLTSAGWNDVLDPLMIQPPDCNPNIGKLPNGDCGNPTMAIIYLVSYVIINFMIIINMYIAVILENFNQAHQEEELGIVEDDIEMFYMHWARFDPYATQFISFFELSDFVDSLDQPLKISKPNMIAIVSFNLPIARGMKIHCLDILHALVKHVLGHVEETDDFQKLRSQMEAKFKKQFPTRKQLELITTTLQWKRVDHAVRILQKGYRNHMRAKKRREEGADPNAPIPNSRPTSRLGRSLRTLSQLLTRQGSSNKFSLRQASRPPTAKSKKGRRGSDASVNSIFYIPPET